MQESSSRSDSNIFNLSSNNSELFPMQDSLFQFQEFKNKVRNLLQTNTQDLDELYFIIQQKTRMNFFDQQFKGFDHILDQLRQVKTNNRSIAKFVSILSQKINKNSQSQKNSMKKNRQQFDENGQKYQINSKSYKNIKQKNQFSQDHQIETNPTEWSREYYNYKYKPFKTISQTKNNLKQDTHTTISNNPSTSYDQYQTRNRLYEQKIKNMLNEVSLIKVHLNSGSQQNLSSIIKAPSANVSMNTSVNNHRPKTIQNITPNRIYSIGSFKQEQQGENKYKIEQSQADVVNNTVTNSLNINQRKQIQIEQTKNQKQMNQNQIISQKKQGQNYLKKVNDRNSILMNYAKKVSQKLQELKAQTSQIQQQKLKQMQIQHQKDQIEYHTNQMSFKTPTEQQHQHLQQQNGDSFQRSFHVQGQSEQKHHTFQYEQQTHKKQKQQKQFDDSLQQDFGRRKNQFTKKKSILDGMKNVQSKVLISQSLIQSQNKSKVQRKSSVQNNIRLRTEGEEDKSKSKMPSQGQSQGQNKKIVISYLTMQDRPKKWNQQSSTGFRSILRQENQRLSNTSSFLQRASNTSSFSEISQNPYQKSNSQHLYIKQNPTMIPSSFVHNTSIMNPTHRISESIPRINIINNSQISSSIAPLGYNRNISMINPSNSNLQSQSQFHTKVYQPNANFGQNINANANSSINIMKNSVQNGNKLQATGSKQLESRISQNNDSFFNPIKYLGMQSKTSNITNSQLLYNRRQPNSANSSFIESFPIVKNQATLRPKKISQYVPGLRNSGSNINLNSIHHRFQSNQIENKSNLSILHSSSNINAKTTKNVHPPLHHSSSLSNLFYVRPSLNGSYIQAQTRTSYMIPKSPFSRQGSGNIQLGRDKRQSQISFGVNSKVQPFRQMNSSVRSESRLSQDSQNSRKSKGLKIYSGKK